MVIQMLDQGVDDTHACSLLVKAIWHILARNWTIHVLHVYREINRCAYLLAKHGQSVDAGVQFFVSLPTFVSVSFLADLSAIVNTRIIGD